MDLMLRRHIMMAQGEDGPTEPDYLTFTAGQDESSIQIVKNGSPTDIPLEYRMNGGAWTAYTYGDTINMDDEDVVQIRNSSDTVYSYWSTSTTKYYYFVMSGIILGSGNIMSILDKSCASLSVGNYCFTSLFKECNSLLTPPDVPATSLSNYCYSRMFYKSGIQYAPNLPATSLPQQCYSNMFYVCTNLTQLPHMQAAILGSSCYNNLVRNCSSLISCHFATLNDSTNIFVQSGVEEIIIDATIPPTIGSNTFYLLKASCIIYVPDASVNDYKTAQYWSARAAYIKGISEKP